MRLLGKLKNFEAENRMFQMSGIMNQQAEGGEEGFIFHYVWISLTDKVELIRDH